MSCNENNHQQNDIDIQRVLVNMQLIQNYK